MPILNITYGGVSADYPLDTNLAVSDADVRRIAVEVLRAGGLRGVSLPDVAERAFDHYVVDRFTGALGDARIYLRPKVPFGAASAR